MAAATTPIGLDVGATGVKAVALGPDGTPLARFHRPIVASAGEALTALLADLERTLDTDGGRLVALTGSGATRVADWAGLVAVNPMVACSLGALALVPHAGAILEVGGEGARFIRLAASARSPARRVRDAVQNSACSAGTGAFLEQEAHRLGLPLEELGRLAAGAGSAAQIAGRCAVFAKTDLIHRQQNGVPAADLARALCQAVAQRIRGELIGHRAFDKPLVFVGGVAANPAIRAALVGELGLDPAMLIVPAEYLYASAIGALVAARQDRCPAGCSIATLRARLARVPLPARSTGAFTRPLAAPPLRTASRPAAPRVRAGRAVGPTLLGLDVGSTSTNVACLAASGAVLLEHSVPTQGRPCAAVYAVLRSARDRLGEWTPRAAGITGSGRHFAAGIVGADLVVNEISAHAAAAAREDPGVDVVIDIGGQDAKFIALENGSVVDFAMNKACSAGTGSFLEEMSAQLGLRIRDEFARAAFRAAAPVDLGERCTVFMSSELRRRQQEGVPREDLAAGLCYSVVRNYLSRVVGQRRIGERVCFQGGVAGNPAIVAALEHVLGRPIRVHAHHEAAGAVGAAILAGAQSLGPSRFRGFQLLSAPPPESTSRACGHCDNACVIHTTRDAEGRTFSTGGLCDRHETGAAVAREEGAAPLADLLAERQRALERHVRECPPSAARHAIGIPRALTFYELLPFWSSFFNHLGVPYRLSRPTSRRTILAGISRCPVNACLPLKGAYGHCDELVDGGAGRIFAPSVGSLPFGTRPERLCHVCSAVQAWPFTARALFPPGLPWWTPTVRFALPRLFAGDMLRLGRELGFGARDTRRALRAGLEAQRGFCDEMEQRGRELWPGLTGAAGQQAAGDARIAAVLLARPYTAFDPGTHLRMSRWFHDLGVQAIPMDFFPGRARSQAELDGMYWYFGRRMLQTVEALARCDRVAFVFLSNFACGADAFLVHFLRQRLPRDRLLELEIDQHCEFTGIGTRLEAFCDALRGRPRSRSRPLRVAPSAPPPAACPPPGPPGGSAPTRARRARALLLPQMSDHAFPVAAAFRASGIAAQVLPLPDEDSIRRGKEALCGQECLPCGFVVGDMLRALEASTAPPPAFFMVSGDGPCRLGQYPYVQRLALDARGHADAPILNASQDETFYRQLGVIASGFERRAWRALVVTDLLQARWRRLRPYVDSPRALDEAYRAGLEQLSRAIETGEALGPCLRRAVARLLEQRVNAVPRRPVVTLVGENYVRCNRIANEGIADLLEELGVEVHVQPLHEWIYYTNWTAGLHCRYEQTHRRYLGLRLRDLVQRRDARRLARAADGMPPGLAEGTPPSSLARLLHLAAAYAPPTLEGEAVLATGTTLDSHRRGMSGVIYVAPFGCIVGTIFETLGGRLSDDLDGFPVLSAYFDGLGRSGLRDRLEVFLLRVRAWQTEHEGRGN